MVSNRKKTQIFDSIYLMFIQKIAKFVLDFIHCVINLLYNCAWFKVKCETLPLYMYPNGWLIGMYIMTPYFIYNYYTIRYISFVQPIWLFFPIHNTPQYAMLCTFFLIQSTSNCHLFRMPMTIVWVRAIDTWNDVCGREIPARKYYVFRKGMYTVNFDDWQRQSYSLTVKPITHTRTHMVAIHDICHACVLNYPHRFPCSPFDWLIVYKNSFCYGLLSVRFKMLWNAVVALSHCIKQ